MAAVQDPVCGMTIDSETAQWRSKYKGATYYFCAPGCKTAFDADPESYLGGESEGHPPHHGPHHGHGSS